MAAALHPASVLPQAGVARPPKLLLDTGALRRGALQLEVPTGAVRGDVASAAADVGAERRSAPHLAAFEKDFSKSIENHEKI